MPVAAHARPSRTTLAWGLVPLIVLIAAALFANAGVRVTSDATAASSSVNVDASVSSITSITPCGATVAISVTQGALSSGTCNISFGASNASSIPLQVQATTTPFLSGGVFANTAVGACGAMTGDSVGFKVATGVTATNNTACAASAAGTNAGYVAVPGTATTVCTTTATGNQDCPIAVGIFETGGNAAAGNYTGTINLSA